MIITRDRTLFFKFRERELPIEVEYHGKHVLDIKVNHRFRIRVRAPEGKELSVIEERLKIKASWILRQLLYFEDSAEEFGQRKVRTGSSVRVLGSDYLVDLQKGDPSSVKTAGKFVIVTVSSPDDGVMVGRTLNRWLRRMALEIIEPIYNRCFSSVHKYGVEWTPFNLKKMGSRWGSCSPDGSIFLNPDLISFPPHLIEYAVLHEMCHLISMEHDARFYKYLSLMMPDWKDREAEMKAG